MKLLVRSVSHGNKHETSLIATKTKNSKKTKSKQNKGLPAGALSDSCCKSSGIEAAGPDSVTVREEEKGNGEAKGREAHGRAPPLSHLRSRPLHQQCYVVFSCSDLPRGHCLLSSVSDLEKAITTSSAPGKRTRLSKMMIDQLMSFCNMWHWTINLCTVRKACSGPHR